MTEAQRKRLELLDYQTDAKGVQQFQRDYNRINRPAQPLSVTGVLDERTTSALDIASKTAAAFRLARGVKRAGNA